MNGLKIQQSNHAIITQISLSITFRLLVVRSKNILKPQGLLSCADFTDYIQ